ncbi:hypothetical protein [Curtobacterium sp. TXMA1]|uniref:hypothetical protein n=1 Tax=Curtobacterium sp. TXMA1 TaxID=2876939 RepID=UPI001CCAFC85|nr:hypothetical protein [Curtobacterium sp. TXMA1]UBQ03200.1 hypothetical protein LCG91_03255 [Curtobacterium sp. TXMA1]
MPDWLVDGTAPDADPWPPSLRARAEAAADRAGLGPEAVRVLLGAALIDSLVRTATRLTVGRTRVQHDGNTLLAADDPQFVEVLRETSGLAVAAVAAAEQLLSGALDREAAEDLQFGVRAITERALDRVFDTLGASATLEHNGLHRLRHAATLLWSEIESAEPIRGRTGR